MDTLSLAAAPGLPDDLTSCMRRTDGRTVLEIAVRGARCAGCIGKIESRVRSLPNVASARLNLSTGKLTVNGDDRLTPQPVFAALHALGYGAQPFENEAEENATNQESRTLIQHLAVAAFGTAFVVGLTDSIWYGGDMSPALRHAFFWLAGAIAVPVTLYAGQPFFRSALTALRKGTANMDVPISAALLLALGLSLYQTARHGLDVYFDAAVMLTFLLLVGRYLDLMVRTRANSAARQLLEMQAKVARRIAPGGTVETIAARHIAVGDRLLLAAGDRAPVNGALEGPTELNLSLVTGESVPVTAAAHTAVQAGSIVIGEPVVLRASHSTETSLIADLARLLEAGQQNRSRYVNLADRAARAYVPLVTLLALGAFAGWMLAGAGLERAITNAIAVLIITCPCALGLAVPAVQVAASGRLFRAGVFVKSGDGLERLATSDTVIFDKTGTLTLGTPVLQAQNMVAPTDLELAARLARASRHPLAQAVATAAGPGPVAQGVREVVGAGLEAIIDDTRVRLGSARWCDISVQAADTGTPAGTSLWLRRDGDTPVRLLFEDRIRPETRAVVMALRARGLTVEMLTGDQDAPARAIAADAGIAVWQSRVGPREKAAYLEKLRGEGHRVLMVGDGLNDAAAMALAHVSIAPGTATEVSQLAADMVLRGASISGLVEAVDVARKTRRLAQQNFALAALYNLIAVPLAATGLITPLVAAATMAASSLSVTLNAARLMLGKAR